MEKKFEHFEIKQDNDEEKHRAASEESAFLEAVSHGNIEAVKKNCEARRFSEPEGVGQLSHDPVLNLKYHFVITCALISRACISSGMIEEQGFRKVIGTTPLKYREKYGISEWNVDDSQSWL